MDFAKAFDTVTTANITTIVQNPGKVTTEPLHHQTLNWKLLFRHKQQLQHLLHVLRILDLVVDYLTQSAISMLHVTAEVSRDRIKK